MRTALVLAATAAALAVLPACAAADDKCSVWRAQVDPTLEAKEISPRLLDDRERVTACECLLGEEGNTGPARFSGATRAAVSAMLPDATVEVAALFYISYIYTGPWQHADGVALVDRENRVVTQAEVAGAYASYRRWLARVKEVGMARARELRLDPLENTDLCWYGSRRCYEMNSLGGMRTRALRPRGGSE